MTSCRAGACKATGLLNRFSLQDYKFLLQVSCCRHVTLFLWHRSDTSAQRGLDHMGHLELGWLGSCKSFMHHPGWWSCPMLELSRDPLAFLVLKRWGRGGELQKCSLIHRTIVGWALIAFSCGFIWRLSVSLNGVVQPREAGKDCRAGCWFREARKFSVYLCFWTIIVCKHVIGIWNVSASCNMAHDQSDSEVALDWWLSVSTGREI